MKPVRWGVIGIGKHFIQRTLLPMQRSNVVELHAAASRNAVKAADTCAAFGIPVSYGSYEDLLADDSIEAVFLPIPNNLHLKWIIKAAEAGKHIICEKPITMTADEAEKAFASAKAHNVLLMEAFMYRFHKQWDHIRDLVRTNAIGSPRAVHCYFSYSNTDPANIRNRPETGGGAIYDLGCYAISSARYIFAAEPSRIMSAIKRDPNFKTDILTSAIMDFGDRHATFSISTQAFPHQTVEIYGTSGRINVVIPFNPFDDTPAILEITDRQGTRQVALPAENHYQTQFEAFSLAIRNDDAAPISADDSINNMRAIDALFQSESTGEWVTLG